MEIETVVFDMDGVLFDTERLYMESWVQAAEEMGIRDMPEVFPLCIGQNANGSKEVLIRHYGEDFPYAHFREQASVHFWKMVEKEGLVIKEGVVEILNFLQASGCCIALASSTRQESVIKLLERAGIRRYFQEIITGDMVEHSKPAPDIYLLACSRLGVEPQRAYAIEDSPNGIRAAYSAGMKPIMVPDMIAPDEEMIQKSFAIYSSLTKVQSFFEKKQEEK